MAAVPAGQTVQVLDPASATVPSGHTAQELEIEVPVIVRVTNIPIGHGVYVGDAVGEVVGAAEGAWVGANDGLAVGCVVGAMVGGYCKRNIFTAPLSVPMSSLLGSPATSTVPSLR